MGPLWFFRFKVLSANFSGCISILRTLVQHADDQTTKSWWSDHRATCYIGDWSPSVILPLGPCGRSNRGCHCPTHFPWALNHFHFQRSAAAFSLPESCPEAARPSFACKAGKTRRTPQSLANDWPHWGYKSHSSLLPDGDNWVMWLHCPQRPLKDPASFSPWNLTWNCTLAWSPSPFLVGFLGSLPNKSLSWPSLPGVCFGGW